MQTKIKRQIDLKSLIEKNSFFLFGPRATGKTSLIYDQFKNDHVVIIDLLKAADFTRLSENPSLLEQIVLASKKQDQFPIVVLDEVQKVPALLDEVHRLMELYKIRFLLCGSSARKLKKEGANLLAGRAWRADLFPVTSKELDRDFDLTRYLRFGGLPHICTSAYPEETLDAYVNTYLKEEIQQEGLVRRLPKFTNFLRLAALGSGHQLNYESFSKEIGVSSPTIKEYYSILIDTLLAFELEPFQETKKRKPVSTSKIYLFDCGVTNFLAQIETIDRQSDIYGNRFEQFIGMEIRAYLSYARKKLPLTYWRSHNKDEVDFIIGNKVAIEVKSSVKVNSAHLNGLRNFGEEIKAKLILVTQDPIVHERDEVLCLSYNEFLKKLWSGEIV